MGNCSKRLFKDYYKDNRYIVKDLVSTNKSKYIFILESPHNEEVDARYPVAGTSGIDMAKYLGIHTTDSFGKYISNNLELGVTIINISQVPLQRIDKLDEKYKDLLDILNSKVRTGYDSYKNHKNPGEGSIGVNVNDIEKIITEDFSNRLEKAINNSESDVKYVICGAFAMKYFDIVYKELKLNKTALNILYVPHPARHQWTRCENDLKKIKDIFKDK